MKADCPSGPVSIRCCNAPPRTHSTRNCGNWTSGVDIVRRALSAPIRQIATNGGLDGSIVFQQVITNNDPNYGFNALTGDYGDMIKMGVLVPTKVERVALQNASSVASLMLTTDCVISEIKQL